MAHVRLIRPPSAAEFLRLVEPFLLQHEAEHNLMLGIAASLSREPDRFEQPPYLSAVEEAGQVIAAAVMTPPRNLVLSRVEAPGALDLFAGDLLAGGWSVPGVLGSKVVSRQFAELWHQRKGVPFRSGMAQRIYALQQVRPVKGVPGRLRRVTENDRTLLVQWVTAFAAEALGEPDPTRAERFVDAHLRPEKRSIFLWEDGQPPRPVSMAASGEPTPNGVRVNAVYTPPELRRRGYASACVAALSQWLLDSGYRYCFLYTDLNNPTSNHIYQAIGYEPVCDVDEYKFESQPMSPTT
ncbi:MAG: GNAT family N-acetyltransferase [Limnochordaceae bacterium]|nr:GNAT family N-acetyltransferase [Limnochordaceae bacterium]